MKIYYITGCIFMLMMAPMTLCAQSSVHTSGGSVTTGSGSVSHSVGQVVYTSGGNGFKVSNGVQQPYDIQVVTGISGNQDKMKMKLYPNPVLNDLVLELETFESSELYFQVYDLHGKLIAFENITDRITRVDFSRYPSSTYLLKVFDKVTVWQTFKIIKA